MPGYSCLPGSGGGPLTITCSGGPALPVTESVSMTVATTLSAAVGATVVTTAGATADQTDADPSDDSATASVKVAAVADLVTTKTVSKATVGSGDAVTWSVTVTNTSSTTAATSVDIGDTLPPGLTPTNVVAPAGFACSVSPSGVQCSAPSLAAGASAELRFDTVVSGKEGAGFTNTASAKSDNDPDTTDNSAKASVAIASASGSVAGTVTDLSTGDPLGGIEVRVFDTTTHEYGGVTTNPDGTYEIGGIAAGDYLVRFHDPSGTYGQQWFDHVAPLSGASIVAVVADARTDGIDAALGEGTQISGTVTSETTGLPLENICVQAFDPDVPTFDDGVGTTATTAADGTYTLTGLASTPYLVLFRDCSKTPTYALELYDGGSGTVDREQAMELTPTGSGLTGIDAALGAGGSISGTVYQLPDHTTLEKRCVVAFAPGIGLLAVAFTGPDGTYRLDAVPAGNWYVASGECERDDGEFVWYAGAGSVAVTSTEGDIDPAADGAALVAVVAGADVAGIDLFFGVAEEGSAPTVPPGWTDPPGSATDPAAANAATSNPVSGSLPKTGVPGPDMAILGGLLLGVGLVLVRVTELRRAR